MYDSHLELLPKELQKRFCDFSSFKHPFASFSAPSTFDVAKAEESLQMELLEMQSDSLLRAKYFEEGIPPKNFIPSGKVHKLQKVCHMHRGNVPFHIFVLSYLPS